MKTDNVLEHFAEMMISRIQNMKAGDWELGWLTTSYGGNLVNLLRRLYFALL